MQKSKLHLNIEKHPVSGKKSPFRVLHSTALCARAGGCFQCRQCSRCLWDVRLARFKRGYHHGRHRARGKGLFIHSSGYKAGEPVKQRYSPIFYPSTASVANPAVQTHLQRAASVPRQRLYAPPQNSWSYT